MASDALTDGEFWASLAGGLRDAGNRGVVGGLLGAPVDLMTMGLRPLGYSNPAPVMGSEWIGQKLQDAGFVSPNRNPVAESLASLAGPAAITKVGRALPAVGNAAIDFFAGAPRPGSMQSQIGAISPQGKARLLADLQAGQGSGTYKLGDVTRGQGRDLDALAGTPAGSLDVFMNDRALRHVLDRRVLEDGFTAEQVARFAEQAMQPRSQVWANPALSHQQPSLVNRGLRDAETGARYDAQMPLRATDEGYDAVSVVPRGLRAPKNKPSKP